MRTIWKFPVGRHVHMPSGAKVLTVQMQDGLIFFWAEVDTDAPRVQRLFLVYGTGHQILDDAGAYVGTCQDGSFVWHFYEQTGP